MYFARACLVLSASLTVGAACWPAAVLAKADYIEVLGGSGEGHLIAPQPNLHDSHLVVAFGHDLRPWLADKLGWEAPGRWEFRVEPFVSLVDQPEDGAEFGCTLALKIAPDLGSRWRPFIKGGTGPIFATYNTLEQSTDLNIVSYAAVGLDYMLDEHSSLGIERWVRHYSNASVRDPNDGVDSSDWLVGYTWYY